ncbi:hypothetical protein BO78DRAFT_39348 [Aspergillus sclerotiicarbonarius CBS 121057]|uniref:Uncharacterized protein n=1 Tax=Aspergillus sclerotiicarbonarius (strain CBS 121057 / IBT 28362) TaxID=1448318 RepID=A0A319ERF5_ASPSB|nr:hypothetical protein BO78DRAFT_39348 [Aspergillus sclerotiicarbonarius CBS 121057]
MSSVHESIPLTFQTYLACSLPGIQSHTKLVTSPTIKGKNIPHILLSLDITRNSCPPSSPTAWHIPIVLCGLGYQPCRSGMRPSQYRPQTSVDALLEGLSNFRLPSINHWRIRATMNVIYRHSGQGLAKSNAASWSSRVCDSLWFRSVVPTDGTVADPSPCSAFQETGI